MIVFHEGLPRSGKSYEAVVKHLIPALAQGRAVYAYVEGLNHDKIAELAEITPERCRELLHQIEREQVREIYKHVQDNALVILDELQNFWPNGRQKLGEEITQFITEHGHRGLDIIGMGQDLRDVHSMWRRRVSQKTVFNKLDAVGMENKYAYRVYKASEPEKFHKVSNGTGVYEERYFGSYKSHVSDDTNTLNYKDKRAVVWNTPLFKFGIPAAILAAVAGIWFVLRIFSGDAEIVKTDQLKPQAKHAQPAAQPVKQVTSAPAPAPAATKPGVVPIEDRPQPEDYIQSLQKNEWRPRLAAWMEAGNRKQGVIEWYQDTTRKESLTTSQIETLGYVVVHKQGVVQLVRGSTRIVVTSWPIDPVFQVNETRNREVAGRLPRDEGTSQPASPPTATAEGLRGVVIADGGGYSGIPTR